MSVHQSNRSAGLVGSGAALALALLVASCEDANAPSAPSKENVAGVEAAEGDPKGSPAKPKCPPKVATPAEGALPYDVVGVRPKMTYDEAANVLLCANKKMALAPERGNPWSINSQGLEIRNGFVVATPETEEELAARMARYRKGNFSDSSELAPGKERYSVTTVGLPKEELVITITSEQAFAEGALPPVDQIREALVKKYGAPTRETKDSGYRGAIRIVWGRDEQARPMATDSPRAGYCVVYASSITLHPECGFAIVAEIKPPEGNDGLASSLVVMSTMPGWANEHLAQSEAAIVTAAAAKKAGEVERARSQSDAPKL